MNNKFTSHSVGQLETLIAECWKSLNGVLERFHDRSDLQIAIKQLMQADDMLSEFSELCDESPELAGMLLQASVAALVSRFSRTTSATRRWNSLLKTPRIQF